MSHMHLTTRCGMMVSYATYQDGPLDPPEGARGVRRYTDAWGREAVDYTAPPLVSGWPVRECTLTRVQD